jgi:hypothetical protein
MVYRRHIEITWVQISYIGSLYIWIYILFKLGFFTSPKTSLKHVFLEFSLPIVFRLVLGSEIFTIWRNNEVVFVKISSLDSLYHEIYSLRKIRFLARPNLSLKHVFWGKMLYMKLHTSKLSETCSIGYGTC